MPASPSAQPLPPSDSPDASQTTTPGSDSSGLDPAGLDPTGLRCDIERGPNWLFAHLKSSTPGELGPAAELGTAAAQAWVEDLWSACDRHFTYRLVVELDTLESLSPAVAEQLAQLGERLAEHDGALRLCGLSDSCQQQLHRAHSPLHNHATRRDAVLASEAHAIVRAK